MTDRTPAEINALLAEKAMEWHRWDSVDDYDGPYPMFTDWGSVDPPVRAISVYEDGESGNETRRWNPWEGIADAMEVVEAMGAGSFRLHWLAPVDSTEGTWSACFSLSRWANTAPMAGSKVDAWGRAKTPARAICRAALKALGVDDETTNRGA